MACHFIAILVNHSPFMDVFDKQSWRVKLSHVIRLILKPRIWGNRTRSIPFSLPTPHYKLWNTRSNGHNSRQHENLLWFFDVRTFIKNA